MSIQEGTLTRECVNNTVLTTTTEHVGNCLSALFDFTMPTRIHEVGSEDGNLLNTDKDSICHHIRYSVNGKDVILMELNYFFQRVRH